MSLLKVNAIQSTSGVDNRGKILQVVTVQYDTTTSVSSSTYIDLYSATIQPLYSTSRIMIISTVAFSGKGGFTVVRGATDLFPASKTYAFYPASATQSGWNSGSLRGFYTLSTIDSPGTTSLITYTTRLRSYGTIVGDQGGVNELDASSGTGHQGTRMILMEIAA